ncbi:hypothetical protein [Moellerella wisconsensis]|uniref:hypothetical protein n=1 Tax=Moellerella wisconsensis TaxID=158849 RepID=UPI00069CA61A
MKERGIIFNSEMVRAILDGRKTQTRRIVNGITSQHAFHEWVISSIHAKDEGRACWSTNAQSMRENPIRLYCPLGEIGDRLYVRETWAVVTHEFDDEGLMVDYAPERPSKEVREQRYSKGYYTGHVIYAADGDFTWCDDDGCVDGRSYWKPSIHMPKWASRITLEIIQMTTIQIGDCIIYHVPNDVWPTTVKELSWGNLNAIIDDAMWLGAPAEIAVAILKSRYYNDNN